jgi:hypothetical protein
MFGLETTMRARRLPAALAIMLATISVTANAAEIKYYPSNGDGMADISITGEIIKGDATRFESIVKSMPERKAIVRLRSPGGRIVDGLNIGLAIRSIGFATFAVGKCTSVCSLMWLAGTSRLLYGDGSIGFHAAYIDDGGALLESGQANARIGAYVAKLGLSFAAVDYMTAAKPQEMTWLTAADAKRIGVEYTFIPATPAVASAQSPAQVAALTPAPGSKAQVGKPTPKFCADPTITNPYLLAECPGSKAQARKPTPAFCADPTITNPYLLAECSP